MHNQDDLVWVTARVPRQLKSEVKIGAALAGIDVSEYLRGALRERLQRESVRVVEAVKNGNR